MLSFNSIRWPSFTWRLRLNRPTCIRPTWISSSNVGVLDQFPYLGRYLFVDHLTDWTYGHLMRSLSLEETLLAKKAFEKLLARGDHFVKRYYADNRRCADKDFLDAVNSCNETISFCEDRNVQDFRLSSLSKEAMIVQVGPFIPRENYSFLKRIMEIVRRSTWFPFFREIL